MGAKINEIVTGEYNHAGLATCYGDSVVGNTIIDTDRGKFTIEDLYNTSSKFWKGEHGSEKRVFL